MKSERNIFIAFILNFAFSIFEFFGGILTGSVAIISDAIHDIGDAASIGAAFFMERKSKNKPDEIYTYGYSRYSVLGGFITTVVLLMGSALAIYNAVGKIISPTKINYNGMIIFAAIGVCVNFCAATLTHKGDSLNQKAVNLHMLEDVLGWIVVLVGAVVMRFTDLYIIDPIMSIAVSLFIIINAIRNMKQILNLFLEKTPCDINMAEIKEHIEEIEGVCEAHHIHIWSLDGQSHLATMHIVTDTEPQKIKALLREELHKHGIHHTTIELESITEQCSQKTCQITPNSHPHHHHHHHH